VRRLHVVQTFVSRQKATEQGWPPIPPTFSLFKERQPPLSQHTFTLQHSHLEHYSLLISLV